MPIKIVRVKQSCFRIEFQDKKIYLDPFGISKDVPKANVILISHKHFDHNSKSSIKSILSEGTLMICPSNCTKIVKQWNARGINPGDELEFEGIKIKAIPAYNKKLFLHKKEKGYNGYLITIGNIRFYHAGDTDLIPEMDSLKELNVDYAMIPCGGTFTMSPQDAIEAVKRINPKNVIFMHERRKSLDIIEANCKKSMPTVNIIKMKPGDIYTGN